jgi:hypothetical protein
MTLLAYLLLAGVLVSAIASHIRLNRALARLESLYAVLYGFKYRIREVEDEVKKTVDAVRYELNPALMPAEAGGCGTGGCGSPQPAAALPAVGLLQIT